MRILYGYHMAIAPFTRAHNIFGGILKFFTRKIFSEDSKWISSCCTIALAKKQGNMNEF